MYMFFDASRKHISLVNCRHYLRVKGYKCIPSKSDGTKKQSSIVVLISDKVDVKPKLVRRHKGGYFIFLK